MAEMSKTKKIITAIVVPVLIIGIILLCVHLFTLKNVKTFLEIPIDRLNSEYTSVIDKQNTYLGHPDLVLTDDGKLLTFYPSGHGKGAIIGKYSEDLGESWQDITDTPSSWEKSQETPCVYNTHKTDGTSVLVLTSGSPYWSDVNLMPDGFNCSVSTDNGATWTEFSNFFGQKWAEDKNASLGTDEYAAYDAIVAMSSLTQLKDEDGNYIDTWLGTFHRGASEYGMDGGEAFVNYATYLTFDEDNKPVWSEPVRLLEKHRELEEKYGMCEIEIIRNPENDCLILIARANNRVSNSVICYSYDEGESWTQPKELPNCLTGDRHKAEYDPVSGKVIISFRQYLSNGDKFKKSALSPEKYLTEGWVAWIGDFEDLMSFSKEDSTEYTYGDKVLILGKNHKQADCGYSGVVILDDGTVITDSYGYFSPTARYPYIMQAKFKINDVI